MSVEDLNGITRTLAMINSDGKIRPVLQDPPGITTSLYDLRLRVFARTPYENLFTELGTLEAAERALLAGCDAIYIDTFGDYGIEQIRAAADVPVVGAGEASIAVAGFAERRFSIVTVWPKSMSYLYAERIAHCSGGRSCAGVHHLGEERELNLIGSDVSVKARLLAGDHALLDELTKTCERVIDADDAEAILLGCTCMAPVGDELSARLPVPILEPSRIGLSAAFTAALAPATERADRRAGQPALAGPLVDAYLAARGLEQFTVGGCEICVVPQNSAQNAMRAPYVT